MLVESQGGGDIVEVLPRKEVARMHACTYVCMYVCIIDYNGCARWPAHVSTNMRLSWQPSNASNAGKEDHKPTTTESGRIPKGALALLL